MSFLGPNIFKINGGLGQTAPSDRNVHGLIFAKGYAVGATFALGGIYELNSIDDATALGLNPASDANAAGTTAALCWYHIDEFFRINPDGKLFVYNGNAVPTAGIFAAAGPADLLLAAAQNGLRCMGVVFGFDPAATLTITGGFWADVATARAAAQAWRTAKAAAFVYIDTIVIEGVAASSTLVDLKVTDAPQVHITVACDHGYLESYDAGFLQSAAVGSALGAIGTRMLSESMGSVVQERPPDVRRGLPNASLVDTAKNRWLKPGLSTGVLFDSLSQTIRDTLTANAYGYVGRYEGYPGVYFNADPTCTLATDDFNSIHANRIWDESARRLRRALIPRMNSRVLIDDETGQIKPATIAAWDAACRSEMDLLRAEGEVSNYIFTMDPNQNVLAQGKVKVKLRVIPQGIAKAIEAEIGFYNPALLG